MFKRIEKRRRKKEEEEELGLDGDIKEVLGMQVTDSDESDTDSDSEQGSDTGNKEDGEQVEGSEEENDVPSAEEEVRDTEGSEADTPEISVQDALEDPVYLVSLEPDLKACIVCPGKLLKHPKMIEVHKSSSAHKRRFTRFAELARQANPHESAWVIIRADNTAKGESEKTSRRSAKRKAKLAAVKAKRDQHREKKAKAKAKQKEKAAEAKAAAEATSPSKPLDKSNIEEPAKKKRKLDQEEKSKRKQHQPPPSGAKDHRAKGKIKLSAAGHLRGKVGGGKMARGKKPKGEHKQKHQSEGEMLKIFD